VAPYQPGSGARKQRSHFPCQGGRAVMLATVTELPSTLEAVTRDPFIDGIDSSTPANRRSRTHATAGPTPVRGRSPRPSRGADPHRRARSRSRQKGMLTSRPEVCCVNAREQYGPRGAPAPAPFGRPGRGACLARRAHVALEVPSDQAHRLRAPRPEGGGRIPPWVDWRSEVGRAYSIRPASPKLRHARIAKEM
jgi:hypothetical protein